MPQVLLQHCVHKPEHPSTMRQPWRKILFSHGVSVKQKVNLILLITLNFSEKSTFRDCRFLYFKTHVLLENIPLGRERGQVLTDHSEHLFQLCRQSQAYSQLLRMLVSVVRYHRLISRQPLNRKRVVGNRGILLLFWIPPVHFSASLSLSLSHFIWTLFEVKGIWNIALKKTILLSELPLLSFAETEIGTGQKKS